MSRGEAVRASGARAIVLVLALTGFELAVRTAVGAARFADATDAALDVAAHLGRVAALAPLAFAVDLTLSAALRREELASAVAVARRLAAQATAPRRVARVLAVAALALPALAVTLGARTQLPWHVGALAAAGVLVAALAVELTLAARRSPAADASPSVATLGLLAWGASAGLLATCVLPFLRAGQGATATMAFVALLLVRLAMPAPRLRAPALGLAVALAAGLVALDARRPELLRFESEYAPFAPLGQALLVFATDLDGDGASRVFGLDCDDGAASVAPFADDVPDDGLDQNCRGGDGARARARSRFVVGGVHAPDAPRGATTTPPVFVVTVDAWRADSFDGATFPRTSAWAARCARFSAARASAPYTGASLVALHMGVFTRHVARGDGWQIDLAAPERGIMSRPPTLAAALAMRGRYRTAVVFPPFHSPNFAFLTGYEEGGTLPDTGGGGFPTATEAFEVARSEMKAAAGAGAPLHLRVHLMDLHTPYPGGAGRSGYLRSARALDAPLADFLSSLPPDAVVVLTADHGEAFGEHGYTQHGHTLFDEELRVPLVLCAPGVEARSVETPVSLVDVAPTLMDLTGTSVPYRRHGESLVPLLHGGARRVRWVFAENDDGDMRQLALVDGCDKLIEDSRAGYRALFDVCADPAERRDLARREPARADRMRALLAEVVDLDLDAFRTWR